MTNRGLIHDSKADHDNSPIPSLTASSDPNRENQTEEQIRIIRGKEKTEMNTDENKLLLTPDRPIKEVNRRKRQIKTY